MASWTPIALPGTGSPIIRAVTSTQVWNETSTPINGDGLILTGLGSVQVEITAPGVETFSGGGNILGWHQNDLSFDASSVWARFKWSDLDLVDANGVAVARFSLPVTHPAGSLVLLASNVTHSGAGANFTLKMFGVARTYGGHA